MTVLETARQVAQWPIVDQLALIDQVIEEIDNRDDESVFSPEIMEELERRLADYRANPQDTIPWEVVKARLGR